VVALEAGGAGPAPAPRLRTWGFRLALAGVLAMATAVRLHWIGLGSLDIDEAFALWVARHPLRGIWPVLARLDDHPPLYYLALHAWVRVFGDTPVMLRMLSVATGVLTVALASALGRLAGGRALGVLAALLIALAPDLVRWSQEARMYALEASALTGATVAAATLLAGDGRSRAAWMGYVGATSAAVWTDYSALLFPVAMAAVLVWIAWTLPPAARAPLARKWALAHLAIVVLCAPVLVLLAQQTAGGTVVAWYALNPYAPAAVALAALLLLVLGRAAWPGDPRWVALTTGLWVVPIACLMGMSAVAPIFVKRAYLWTDVPLGLALAAALLRVRGPALRLALAAAIALGTAAGLAAHYRNDLAGDALRGWDRAAAYVAGRARAGDLLLFYVPYVQPAFDYYSARYRLSIDERGVPADFGGGRALFPPLGSAGTARVRVLLAGRSRVWLVHGMYPSATPILDVLGAQGHLIDSRTVTPALTIYLYDMDSARPSK
jgi:mannosyltransferase